MSDQNTLLLRVQLDEGKTTDRLKQLVVDLAKTRQEQKELTQAYNQGLLSEEAYGKKSFELSRQLQAQRTEQTALTKNLDLYQRAVNGVAGSYDQAQAQLSLAQRQYQQLAGSQTNATEETQALSKVIDELRGSLKTTDAQQGLYVRNVGAYHTAVEPLVQQLVKLREEEKGLAAGSKELAENQKQQIGFQIAAQRAAAQAGKSYDEANTAIENYAKSIQPATAELVKLEQEQARLVETGEATSETVQRIGFKMSQMEKHLKDTAKATPALGDIGEDSEKAAAGLDDVAKVAGPLAPVIEKLNDAKEKYTAIVNLAKVATAGETTALGALKLAFIATGIGAFVVILGSLIAFLTKTQAGSDFLSRKLGALGAIVTKLTSYVVDFGGKIFAAFENPKQALTDLVDFIGNNLLNRLKSVAVLLDGIRNGDLTKIGDSFVQFTTGITDATAKLRGLTKELGAVAAEGEKLAQMEQELERATNDNIDTNKRLLNETERLKNIRDNEFNTLAVRRKANEDAFKVEMQRENTLAGLAQQRIDILRRRLELEGGRSRNEALFKELKEAENELVDIREDAAGKQNELITNRYQLYKEGQDMLKEAAEKAAEANRQQLQVELGLLDIRLQAVRKNSDEELDLLRKKLDTQYRLELAAKDLTVGQKKLADEKYQANLRQLEIDNARARAAEVLQIEVNSLAAQLSAVAQGGAQELALRQQQIEAQRQQQLKAIDTRLNDEAQAAQRRAINAAADRQQDDLLYTDKLKKLTTFGQQRKNELEKSNVEGLLSEKEYQQYSFEQQLAALTSQIALAKKFGRDTADLDQQVTDLKLANMQRVADRERVLAEERVAVTQEIATLIGEFYADSLEDAGSALETFARQTLLVLINSVQKALLASQIEILARAFSKADSIETFGALGGIRAAVIIAAVTAATAPLKRALTAAPNSKFAGGTLLGGASHANGGTGLFNRSGYYYGEAEEGEAVINKRSTAMFLPLLSQINQMGGGRNLLAGRVGQMPARMVLGSLLASPSIARQQLAAGYGAAGAARAVVQVPELNYDALAAAMERVTIVTKVQDIMAGVERVNYTRNTLGKD